MRHGTIGRRIARPCRRASGPRGKFQCIKLVGRRYIVSIKPIAPRKSACAEFHKIQRSSRNTVERTRSTFAFPAVSVDSLPNSWLPGVIHNSCAPRTPNLSEVPLSKGPQWGMNLTAKLQLTPRDGLIVSAAFISTTRVRSRTTRSTEHKFFPMLERART
jgi:hypothetical protein